MCGCFRSAFGDKSLFMQHVRMEKDLALRPEWLAATQAIVRFQQSQGQYYYPDLPWN